MCLLQVEIVNAPLLAGVESAAAAPLLTLLLKGGWMMLPILLLSILAVYAIVERLIALQLSASVPKKWLEKINATILAGDREEVLALCDKQRYAIARIITAGIAQHHQPTKVLEKAVESAAQVEVYKLEKNLSMLGSIAGAAPMLGFLGTVVGMIQAFMAIADETTQISPKLLSGGIYEAMITTAAGLVVGIIASLGYNYLLTRVQKATRHIEHAANELLERIGK